MSVIFTIKASDEFDDIAAGIASGKAVPNILGKADHKGVGVVAPMNGTRAEELIPSFFKRCHPRLGVKYRHDGDAAFEIGKIEMVRDHLGISGFVERCVVPRGPQPFDVFCTSACLSSSASVSPSR